MPKLIEITNISMNKIVNFGGVSVRPGETISLPDYPGGIDNLIRDGIVRVGVVEVVTEPHRSSLKLGEMGSGGDERLLETKTKGGE